MVWGGREGGRDEGMIVGWSMVSEGDTGLKDRRGDLAEERVRLWISQ